MRRSQDGNELGMEHKRDGNGTETGLKGTETERKPAGTWKEIVRKQYGKRTEARKKRGGY